MSERRGQLYEFGRFTLDAANRLLLRDGGPVPLHPKAIDTLLLLVERRGEVMAKEELITRLWPDSFVEDSNLSQNVYVLRKTLGRDEDGVEYIRTVPKRGYLFVAEVRERGERPGVTNSDLRAALETESSPAAADVMATQAGYETAQAAEALAPGRAGRRGRRALIVAALAIGLCIGAYLWLTGRERSVETGAAVRSIAVLPFKPLAAAGRDESLELGMADTLITRLAALRQIVVRPTSTVRGYTSLEQDPAAAGRELSVDAILDGSIQRDGERIRVTARLVWVADGGTLWAGQFDERFTDIFSVQDAISERVAQSLSLRLSGEEGRRLARRETGNAEAYLLYLKGRYHWNKRTPDGLKKGAEYFQQAIDLDPAYALAYSGLADSYFNLGPNGWVTAEEARTKCLGAARRAVQLDPELAEARTSLGAALERFEWDFAGAEREYRQALELSPEYATARQRYGMYLSLVGRHDEALAELDHARRLDPVSLAINTDTATVYFKSGRYDQAIKQLRKTVELDPNFPPAHFLLARCYVRTGRYDEAIVEAQRARALFGGDSIPSRVQLGRIYALSGRRDEALKVLTELEDENRRRRVSPVAFAALYSALGDKDRAFQMFEKAFEERAPGLLSSLPDPETEQTGVSSDPRLADLRRRIGLP